MRYIYLLLGTLLVSVCSYAQTVVTNPAPQLLPYSQNFDNLAYTSTTYPVGWQGWQLGTSATTSISTSFRTTTPFQDKALVASGDAAASGGNIYNYNGKIGFLATGSFDPAIALSIKTTGFYNVLVGYDAMTIRNPNARTEEFALQYRVGSTGDFTTLSSTIYSNNLVAQTGSGVTTPQNVINKSINLPAACDNKDTVQLRWVSRDVGGSGGRPSFAVDNIAISGATTPPSTVSIAAGTNAAEPSTNGSFTVNLSVAAPTGGLSIGYILSGTATAAADYTDPQMGTIVVPAGASTATIAINVLNDDLAETTETIIATLTPSSIASPYIVTNGNATINLLDDGDITPVSYTGAIYSQDFNTLATTGTSDVLPVGWVLTETGSGANSTYSAGDGSNNAGNTYSFGIGTATERSFGGLRSGSVVPIIGAVFRNNSGATISSVIVTYTGKQWRVGTANRADRLDFQYSTNATRLNNGTWTSIDALDYSGPQSATAGAIDGNATPTTINFTITGLAIPSGGSFLFRWTDFDASGADDGLAIDNFILSPGCTPPTNQPTALTFTPALQSISGSFTNAATGAVDADRYLVIISSSATLTEQPSAGTTYALDDAIGGGRVIAITDGTSNAFTASDLTPGTPYYFFVYAFSQANNCYDITNPLTASQATITPPPCTPPATQVSAITASTITPSAITLSYTRGSGDNILILARKGDPVRSEPINSLSYAVGSTIGSGDTVVYNGPAASFTYSSLSQNTAYYFALYEYGSATNCYLKPAATANFTTACATPVNVTALVANAGNAQAVITWNTPTASCFDEVLVVVSTSAINGDGSTYTGTGNPAYTGAGGPQVVYRGIGNNVTVTGLANGTTYFIKVFTRLNSIYSNGVQVNVLPFDPASGYLYLFGNFHDHSSYSDGNKDNTANTPDEDFAFARDSRCMDYMGMSDHNHNGAGMLLANFHKGYTEANSVNLVPGPAGNTMVTLWGMEWGVISGGGHVLNYGFDSTLLGWEAGNYDVFVAKNDYASLFNTINSKPGAVAMLAHPNSTDFGNIASTYSTSADNAIVGVAVESGPAFSTSINYNDPPSRFAFLSYFRTMLARGYHLAPDIDQDNHNLTHGRANANRTVILAAAKTREAIMEALRNSRFYASEDCNLRLDYKLGNAPMGSTVTNAGAPSLTLNATDIDGETITTIEIWGGEAGNNTVPAAALRTYGGTPNDTITGFTFNASDAANTQPNNTTYYYYVIVTEADGDRAITAPIWYTRNESILPVTLLSFSAVYADRDKSVHLNWATTQEVNSKSFVVERSSDGQHFTAIGTVAASGNTQGVKQYRFTDSQPLLGTSYYRLQQIDVDNRSTSSRLAKVNTDGKATYALYPNPAKSLTYLYSNSTTTERVTVQVIDDMGREVNKQIKTVSNAMPATLDVSRLRSGTYFIKITSSTGSTTERLLIQ